MTKRFTVPVKYRFSHSKIQLNGEPLTNDELVRILNTNDGAFIENFSLKQENEQLNAQKINIEVDRDYFRTKASSLEEGYLHLQDREIQLKKENEQLKSENNMLKNTIARNELYIEKLTHKGEWSN